MFVCQQMVVVVQILTLIAKLLEHLKKASQKVFQMQLCLQHYKNW